MATSNSRDFDLDVGELIEEAYERCGLEMRTGYDARTARRSLNLMFADWANRGLNLWTVKQETVSVVSGTATYTLDATYVDLLEVVLRNSSNTDFTLTQMSRNEYLTIPNEAGTNAKAVLIGDYKVNQPKDGAIQREGVMQTPMLEENQDKQAF